MTIEAIKRDRWIAHPESLSYKDKIRSITWNDLPYRVFDVKRSMKNPLVSGEDFDYYKLHELVNVPSLKYLAFSKPYQLKHIDRAINDSSEILNLQDNWDEDGASATDYKTYKKAIDFVINYSTYLHKSPLDIVIEAPFIDIMRDGSISVLWETLKAKLLIIFKKNDSEFSYLYGEEKSKKIPFQYGISNEGGIDQITALWMYKNLR